MTGSIQVNALKMVQQLFNSYRVIDKIDLKENAMKTVGPYNPAEPKAQLIEQLEKGREFAQAGRKNNFDTMMVSKGFTLLEQTEMSKKIFGSGDKNPPTSIHGPVSRPSSANIIENRGEWPPPQERGATQRQYTIYVAYRHPR